MLRVFFCFFLLISSVTVFATTSDTTKPEQSAKREKFRRLKIALNYSSDNIFKGRKTSSSIPVISPLIKYTTKPGLFAQVSLTNTPSKKASIFDELDAGIGWLFDFSDKWDGSVSYSHYFFSSKSARINATVQNDLGLSLGFDWSVLYSRLLADYSWGSSGFSKKGKGTSSGTKDFGLTFMNSHDFVIDLTKKSRLTISPEADLLFGTQNFLSAFNGKSDTSQYQKQASAFSLTAYVLYLDVKYKLGKFYLLLSPSYTIPQNVPTGESSSSYFVMSGSIYFLFRSKSKKT